MTGNLSSSMARDEPDRFPEAGRRGARRVRPRADLRVGLDRGEAATRQVLADRGDQGVRQAGAARLGRGGDAGDDRGKRRVRECGIEVARALRARVRSEGPELRIDLRDVVVEQDLRVAPGDAESAAQQLQLARCLGTDGRALDGPRSERVVDRPGILVARGQERVGRAARRERIGRGRPRLEIRQERIGGRGLGRVGGRTRRRGCQPGQARGLRPAHVVLPVVARAMVEARVCARRDEAEAGDVGDVDDPDVTHRREVYGPRDPASRTRTGGPPPISARGRRTGALPRADGRPRTGPAHTPRCRPSSSGRRGSAPPGRHRWRGPS